MYLPYNNIDDSSITFSKHLELCIILSLELLNLIRLTLKKIFTFLLVCLLAPIIAGVYGIIHDQLTYSISPEYYTKCKFLQFNISPSIPDRLGAASVGWRASWWTGIPIGIILGLVGFFHTDYKTMFKITMRAFLITIVLTIIFGIFGLLYGKLYLAHQPAYHFPQWYIPKNIIDFKNFIAVGSMHNFCYLGGLLGMISGIIYSIRILNNRKKENLNH